MYNITYKFNIIMSFIILQVFFLCKCVKIIISISNLIFVVFEIVLFNLPENIQQNFVRVQFLNVINKPSVTHRC